MLLHLKSISSAPGLRSVSFTPDLPFPAGEKWTFSKPGPHKKIQEGKKKEGKNGSRACQCNHWSLANLILTGMKL